MDKLIACEICGSFDSRLIQKAEPPYNVLCCKMCGLVYVNPQPDRNFVFSGYSSQYYQDWMEKQTKARAIIWANRIKKVLSCKAGGLLLDVGCGEGSFLNAAKEKGFQVFGQEVSVDAVSLIQQRWGIKVFCGELIQAGLEKNSFDVITLWHSLEHMPNPQEVLKECCRLLKDDGLLAAAVPNLNNFIFRFFYFFGRQKFFHFFSIKDREKHLFYFSTQTLSLILKKTGFQIKKIGLSHAPTHFWQRIIDWPAILIARVLKINLGQAIEVFAGKKNV